MLINKISASNNLPMQSFKRFRDMQYLQYTHRNPEKMGLRYKMDTIFVFSTPNNPSTQSFSQKGFLKILGPRKWNSAKDNFAGGKPYRTA